MLRWGIIGTGDISSRMVADLLDLDPACVVAVWGRTPEKADAFARQFAIGSETHDRARLLGNDDVDIVYIATPAETHLAIALEALEAGKHVLVEKPMATSAADVALIFERAATAGLFAMEAMWMRFNPLHVELRDRIVGGELGAVRSLRASFGTPFHPRGNRLTPAMGTSALRDRGIYTVTLATWFLGEPEGVIARGVVDGDIDVSGHATLDFSDGRFAHLAWSGVEFLDLSASISGERGWTTLDPMFWAGTSARVHAGSAERIFGSPELVEHRRVGNGYGPMLAAVCEVVSAGQLEHPRHDSVATLAVARVLDCISAQIVASTAPDKAPGQLPY